MNSAVTFIHRVIKHFLVGNTRFGSVIFFVIVPLQALCASSQKDFPLRFHASFSPNDSVVQTLCDLYPERHFGQRMRHTDQQCYTVLIENQPVGYGWVSLASAHISEIAMDLTIGSGRLYVYDCFVDPKFRGRGIYQQLLRQILSDYSGSNISAAFIGVEPHNTASIRAVEHVGFKRLTRVDYLKLGSLTRRYGDKPLRELMSEEHPLRV